MISDSTDAVICSSCGRRNWVCGGIDSAPRRCGVCHAILPVQPALKDLVADAAVHAFFRGAKGLALLIGFAIPLVVMGSALMQHHSKELAERGAAPTKEEITLAPNIEPYVPAQPKESAQLVSLVKPAKPVPKPLPATGDLVAYTPRERVAPLVIESPQGGNYVVKLSDVNTNEDVLVVFVRGGTTVSINVPLGTYVVKYANGDRWYGYDHLFGERGDYGRTAEVLTFQNTGCQVLGYTLSFHKRTTGNLHTEAIDRGAF